MKRNLALVLFYAALVLVIADMHAIASRFSLQAPDPISWLKVGFAVFSQLLAIGLGYIYFWFLSKCDKPNTSTHAILETIPLRFVPVIGLGLLAAYSYTMLYNGMNCGTHPLPSNRGMTTCPR